MRAEDMKQVEEIIDYAASHEDKEAILEEHKMKIRGIEAPDGTSDAMRIEDMKEVDETIGYTVTHKDEILAEKRSKQVGVEAPGTSRKCLFSVFEYFMLTFSLQMERRRQCVPKT
jgi:hypothetical protein